MEGKKISFGFKKTKKVEKPIVEDKKDFIECLEEKSIKVVGGENVEEEKPLVIPMKPNTLITAERLKEIAEKVECGLEEDDTSKKELVDVKLEPVENETLDQMAVRELMQDAKQDVKIEQQELTVPVPAKPVMDGEKESTLEDYESVPIQDFGMAMLRGMGWTANKEQLAKYKQPQLRPKGLGLGADKVISDKQKKKASNKDGKEEELAIVKNSYVKIIAGKHSGYYGKVVSLDEDNGRVMVDITVKKETVSLSEFMMQPVTKAEFDKESKVINTSAFEEYKKKEKSENQKSSTVTEKQRNSPKVNDREASSSRRSNDVSKEKREEKEELRSRNYDNSSNGKEKNKQDRSRRDQSNERDSSRKNKHYRKDSTSSEDRNKRIHKEKTRRDSSSSEDRKHSRKVDRSKRDTSSEDRGKSSRRKRDDRRDSSSEDRDKSSRRNKYNSKRDSSSDDEERSSKRKMKSKRDSSSEDGSRRKKGKEKKRYSSDESLDSISDSDKKKKHKNHRKRKDSSGSDSETHKKDRRDIDKKRKGKKKKRDRDRSPNYKKHRK